MFRYFLLPSITFFLVLFLLSCNSNDSYSQVQRHSLSQQKNAELRPVPGTTGLTGSSQVVSTPLVPKHVTFAGHTIPLERDDVREALEYELTVNMFRHSKTLIILKNIERWRPLIEKTLEQNGVPKDFLYLAVAESEFDNTAQSYVGAVGMWQFMESTAKEQGLHIDKDADMRRDPKLATEAACRYLKKAYALFNDWTLVAASYNRGISGIQTI